MEGISQQWAAVINTAAAVQLRRPRQLLVLINPYGGKRDAVEVYNRQVAAVFEKAGIKTVVKETQFAGHALSLLMDMSVDELSGYDGVVAVGGDGLFHEIVNALLRLRSMAVKRSTTEAGGDTLSSLSLPSASNDGLLPHSLLDTTTTTTTNGAQKDILRKAAAARALRVGHIPAGSTDAVACTLNGTRNAFSAAMRVALGDAVPLDVLRIDAADGTTEFAMSMASYGFMGDLMAESEKYRWMGPLRYEVMGAKMLAANRSYRAKISYLPAEAAHSGGFRQVCYTNCGLCAQSTHHHHHHHHHHKKLLKTQQQQQQHMNSDDSFGGFEGGFESGLGDSILPSPFSNTSASTTTEAVLLSIPLPQSQQQQQQSQQQSPPTSPSSKTNSPFALHSRHSLNHRQSDWVTVEDDFAGIMLVIMPCRSDKSTAGVARYGHLSDGNIHLVLVRRCSRLQYLRFLMTLSSVGLEPGRHMNGVVEVIPATAVRMEPGAAGESQWNVDGELLRCAAITSETHRGAIEVFARGVECT